MKMTTYIVGRDNEIIDLGELIRKTGRGYSDNKIPKNAYTGPKEGK